MSSHSLRKHLLRYRPQRTRKQKAMHTVRKYSPWVAAICVGTYLPPKLLSAVWQHDQDDIWNNAAEWDTGVVPNAKGAFADFSLNFGVGRSISLTSPTPALSISPTVGKVRFDDTVPTSTLSIITGAAQKLMLNSPSNLAYTEFNVTKGNTLSIASALNTTSTVDVIGSVNLTGLNKTGAGVLEVRGVASYQGVTTLSQGIFVASTLANGGVNSSIGASSSAASNLVFDGGTLRYTVGAAVTTDRGFTIAAGGANIDSSSTTALKFTGQITTSGNSGDRTLTLRGTSTAVNEIANVIADPSGGVTSVIKLDAGLWRLSGGQTGTTNVINPNTYTGDTVVQRGTLQLAFPGLPAGVTAYDDNTRITVINPLTNVKLGSAPGSGLPGGGILDLFGGTVTTRSTGSASSSTLRVAYNGAIQAVASIEVDAGLNQITRSSGAAVLYVDNLNNSLVHRQGGDLRLTSVTTAAASYVRTSDASPALYGALVNGWTYMDDNFVTTAALQTTGLATDYHSPLGLIALPAAGYVVADELNHGPSSWNPSDNISIVGRFNEEVIGAFLPANEVFINTLRLSGNPASPSPNKQFRISDGDEVSQPEDYGFGRAVLTLGTGGLLMTATSGPTQIDGGALTSGSGEVTGDPLNYKAKNGGTPGRGELFTIVRTPQSTVIGNPGNALFLSSAITDFVSTDDSSRKIAVGITKSGAGNLVLFDSTNGAFNDFGVQTGALTSDYSGDNYINEGGIFVRADHTLGLTQDAPDVFLTPADESLRGTFGKTYILGTTAFLDFQGVNYTTAEDIKIFQGELRASLGRSTFAGTVSNLNEDAKVPINVAAYLELNGAITGSGGFSKTGDGLLVVGGSVTLSNRSEYANAGDLELAKGSSSWNGDITIDNGNLSVISGQHSINGGLKITNGHIINANSTVGSTQVLALTKPGGSFNTDFQQSSTTGATTTIGSFGTIAHSSLAEKQILAGDVDIQGGSIVVNGSIDFNASFNATAGTLTQLASVNPYAIPTTTFAGVASFLLTASTSTLNHNTIFNGGVVIGAVSTGTAALVLNGLGQTTFNQSVSVVGGTLAATNATFTLPYTHSAGNLTLNGGNTFNKSGATPALTITGGVVTQAGTRRTTGLYAVRDSLVGDLTIDNAATPTGTLAPVFNGSLSLSSGSNIVINGSAPLTGITSGIVNATFANAQRFAGKVTINGGQVIVANSNALGIGGQGVTLAGEKPELTFQRGVKTASGENITIAYSDNAYVAGVAVTAYGSYTVAPTINISSAVGAGATATVSVLTTQPAGFGVLTVTNVGGGYQPLTNTVTATASGGTGSGATFAPVFGGAIIRGFDQHNVIDGSIVLDNANINTGKVAAGIPMISVGIDDSLQITGDIYGTGNVTSGPARQLTTGILGGGANNSSSGIIILSGTVKDTVGGTASGLNVLNTEWAGNNELNIQVEKNWGSNGLINVAQGVMRFTGTSATVTGGLTNFFGAGVTPSFELSTANKSSVAYNAPNTQVNASFFLTADKQVFNATNFTVRLGNSNKQTNDGQSTGFAVIGGENTSGTATYGPSSGFGTITLDSDTGTGAQLRDLRIVANAGGTVDIRSAFIKSGNGSVSIDKIGAGTVRLLGGTVNSALDRVYVLGGTLELAGFGATGNTTARLNASGSTTGQVILGGGTLRLNTTDATAAVTQGMYGNVLAVRNGLSEIQVQSAGQASTLQLGASTATFTRSVGGAVRFSTNGSGTINFNATTASLTQNVALPWATFGTSIDPTSANAATGFALVNASGVSRYNGATAITNTSQINASTPNVEEAGTGFSGAGIGTTTLNTVAFAGTANAGSGILDLSGQSVTLAATGGLLVESTASGANRFIRNGTLLATSGGDIIIQNWGGDGVTTGPSLTISAAIGKTGAFSNALTLVGDGTTILTETGNTFAGDVYVEGGTLKINAPGVLGASKNLLLDGGALYVTDDVTSSNRNVVVFGDRGTLRVDVGRKLTLSGTSSINSMAPEIGESKTAYGSTSTGTTTTVGTGDKNIFNGDLVVTGGGTVEQIRDGANLIAGQILVQSNSRLAFEGNNGLFMGNNISWMDGTTVESGSTLELRPTASAATAIGEWIKFGGAGQSVGGVTGGAIELRRPTAVATGGTDHEIRWTGLATMTSAATILVDDAAESGSAGVVGLLSFDDNIFDGGGFTLTKKGNGILRFINNRIQNLPTINVTGGELRFEGTAAGAGGILGTVGSAANAGTTRTSALAQSSLDAIALGNNNYYTGTSTIVVGNSAATSFAANPRLQFTEARGTHNVDITLQGGFLLVQSADAPLQATSFAGNLNLSGLASTNALEASFTTRVNPVVMFGPVLGSGGLTKLGANEVDFVNPGNSFTGALNIARGGASVSTPSVGLYDLGRLTGVSTIRMTNDATLNLDNRNSLDADTTNDNQLNRINDAAALEMGGNARLRLLGSNTANSSETVGTLTVHRGSSAIELDPGSGMNNTAMTFQNFNRDAGSVVSFRVLKSNVEFGTATGAGVSNAGTANIYMNAVNSTLLVGGDGSVNGQNRSVLIGAFGGVVARDYASLASNTSLALTLNNNDQLSAARHFLTLDGNVLRPLKDSEYLTPTVTGNSVRTTYDFKNTTDPLVSYTDQYGNDANVRLKGGFGAFSSYKDEGLFATEGLGNLVQADDSKRQDSLYRVLSNVTFNTLSFAQQSNELVNGSGNRIILEIEPDKALTITSGMILNAGLGVLNAQDPNPTHNSVQQSLIRGGTLEFGSREIILQNVAAGLSETTGLFSSTAVNGGSALIAGNNIGLSDLIISSTLHGTGGLTKSGAGGVDLQGSNTYSGTTNVTEGILRLENDKALGSSNLVVLSGTGELHLQRSITVGSSAAPHALKLRVTDLAQASQLRSEAGRNAFYGDIQLDTTTVAGERLSTTDFTIAAVNSLILGGDIYGLNSSTADVGTNPLNDLQRGRQARLVAFQGVSAGSVIDIRGSFRDTQSGALSSLVTSATEDQVLRAAFTGVVNSSVQVHSQWDAAGSLLLRGGALKLMPGVTDFFTPAAANAINTSNAQAHPIIGDAAGADVLLSLTTAGQVFNSPTLQITTGGGTSLVTLAGANSSGSVRFLSPSASDSTQFNSATLRTSTWDRAVRLYAADGGTSEFFGRITDSNNSGSVSKIGGGTVVLHGMSGDTSGYTVGTSNNNDFDRGFLVTAGTLVLDYNVSQVAGAAANIWGVAATPVSLGGGKLQLTGDVTDAATQTWGTLTVRPGSSELAVLPTGTTALGLILGGTTSVTQVNGSGTAAASKNGGSVNFVVPNTSASIKINGLGNGGIFTSANGSVLGPWATFGTATGTATTFAAFDSFGTKTVVGLADSAYTNAGLGTQNNPSSYSAGAYVTEPSGSAFTTANLTSGVKLVRFGANSTASTLNLPVGFVLGNGGVDEGAILVPTNTTARKTIAAGAVGASLTTSGGKDLFLYNYGTGGLTVSVPIAGTQNLVLAGPGTTTLGSGNFYTGNTYLNGGVVEVSALNVAPSLSVTASITSGSTASVGVSNIANIRVGSAVTGTGIASGATVASIDGNNITLSANATVTNTTAALTFTSPSVAVSTTLTTTASSTSASVASATGLAVGQLVVGSDVPAGTTITAISGTTITLSNPAIAGAAAVASNFGLANSFGLSTTAAGSAGTIIFNGGTLRYTGPSDVTNRGFTIGDAGATFDIPLAAQTLQIGALAPTLSSVNAAANPYAGGLTKIGSGTLVVTGAVTYTGPTVVEAGVLQVNGTTPLGSSVNSLDGTLVKTGATLRYQTADLTTGEWLTFQNNSTLEISATAARTINFDGVTTLQGRTNVNYSGTLGGNATASFNTNSGYIRGSGTFVKNTINNGVGGSLELSESSPEWTGGLEILGGRVVVKSLGTPLGTGTTAIQLGTSGVNDLSTATSSGFAEANLFFRNKNIVDVNGGSSLTGGFETFPSAMNIAQDIFVNKASTANGSSPQLKQIGISNLVVGTATTSYTGSSLDSYNFNGNFYLSDTVQFLVEDQFLNVNAGGEYVNFNINGHLVSQTADGGFTTKVNITGRPSGAIQGAYNNLFAVVNLNNSNPNFTGSLTLGNDSQADIDGNLDSNRDANHILRLNNNLALNKNNGITLLNDVTVQLTGHNVTIGSLIDGGDLSAGAAVFNTTGTTTADIIQGSRAIVENASSTPGSLTVTQNAFSTWSFLVRDGFLATGAQAAPLTLVKSGPGVVILTNPNTYSGGTLITDGVLLVRNSDGSATGTGNVTVKGGGFGGAPSVPVSGTLTISNEGGRDGVLTPGLITEQGLTLGNRLEVGDLVFTATNGGRNRAEFDLLSDAAGGNADRVVANSITLNSPVELVLRLDADSKVFTVGSPTTLDGEPVQLFSSTSNIAYNGGYFTYQGVRVGDGSDLHAVYRDDSHLMADDNVIFRLVIDDSTVTLYAVPEPNVALTLASGVGMLLGLQRFRRRAARG